MARITVTRMSGTEEFREQGTGRVATVQEFWQWACSEIGGNTMRGRVAEFLVARSLGLDGGHRSEWAPADIVTLEGREIEVKSASYAQVWEQREPSVISFAIARTHRWEAQTGASDPIARRQAQVYVFAVLGQPDAPAADPLSLDDWEFFVIPTQRLDDAVGEQKTITLSALLRLEPVRVRYGSLAATLVRVLGADGA